MQKAIQVVHKDILAKHAALKEQVHHMVESVKDKVKIIVKELFSVVKIRLAGMDKFVTDKV